MVGTCYSQSLSVVLMPKSNKRLLFTRSILFLILNYCIVRYVLFFYVFTQNCSNMVKLKDLLICFLCNTGVNIVLKYATSGMASVDKFVEELGDEADECVKEVFKYFLAVETVKKSQDEHEVARIVEEYRLMREHVPTWMMKSKEVCV